MKQHITKKQWYKLNPEEMAKFFIVFNKEYIKEEWFKYWRCETVKRKVFNFRPNIGQMIEFLDEIDWNMMFTDNGHIAIPLQKYLCDILWENVKYKLK